MLDFSRGGRVAVLGDLYPPRLGIGGGVSFPRTPPIYARGTGCGVILEPMPIAPCPKEWYRPFGNDGSQIVNVLSVKVEAK